MNDVEMLNMLKGQFSDRASLREKRPDVFQLVAPLYHEDGDMVDIYLQSLPDGRVRISDYAMTLMRLSYSYDVDSPNKERILQKILSENRIREDNGSLLLDVPPESICPGVLQFAQTVAKVSSMRLYRREVIQSLFLESLLKFVDEHLQAYRPKERALPIPERDDLEVDVLFETKTPIYLFGAKDVTRTRLAAISCLEFQRAGLPFKSVVVHEDFESVGKKDRNRITSAADKQFTSLEDFTTNAVSFFQRAA
jgi:hypothetical protein